MASLNLFANLDKFLADDANCSFGQLEDDNDIVELPEDRIAKPKIKGRRGRASKKTNPPLDSDDSASDNEVKVSPGVGQKTAYKKFIKLKDDLATTVKATGVSKRKPTINTAIEDAIQKKRSRRARATATATTAEIQFDQPIMFQRTNPVEAQAVNVSFDDEDELSVNVKIKWEVTFKIEKIPFSMYKTFKELIGILSARENVDANSFLLMLGSYVIKPDDSPHSIGYTLGKFISVRIVDDPESYFTESSSTSQLNTIEVKIQYPQWKRPINCNIKLTDQFKVLCCILSEKLKCNPSKIRLKFDGDLISITSTPQELDFDGGEIIDLLMTE